MCVCVCVSMCVSVCTSMCIRLPLCASVCICVGLTVCRDLLNVILFLLGHVLLQSEYQLSSPVNKDVSLKMSQRETLKVSDTVYLSVCVGMSACLSVCLPVCLLDYYVILLRSDNNCSTNKRK